MCRRRTKEHNLHILVCLQNKVMLVEMPIAYAVLALIRDQTPSVSSPVLGLKM